MLLLSVLWMSVAAVGQSAPRLASPALPRDPRAFVLSLYRIVHHDSPADLSEPKDVRLFGPYLSDDLRRRTEVYTACERDWGEWNREWDRKHPGEPVKGPFGEEGMFSGSADRSWPQFFHVERVAPDGHGGFLVTVRLKVRYDGHPPTWDVWRVVVELVKERGRLAVNDLVYLKDEDSGRDYRLTGTYSTNCNGPHFKGWQ
ncbi:hypothetical protein SAMN05421819_3670 [Bryocella elongata]|uniref:Uncharacterized protein n=1 Tax=Bryocella elongata TaxID=863522 RepID=A0A1H6BFJ2_9BACT|nr:hypothetical protein [Bryocella elongata]SEG59528.1 hypothetical protein SAMN05421819_3670 [Bryocella elongata]